MFALCRKSSCGFLPGKASHFLFVRQELMYQWNYFPSIGQSRSLLEPIQGLIEARLSREKGKVEQEEEVLDDYARCMLLKGLCLRYSSKEEVRER